MLQLKIEKTREGFILREHAYTATASASASVLAILSGAAIFSLAGHLDTIREQIGGYLIAAGMAAMAVRAVADAVIHWGRRLVLDGEGCRLQGKLLREKRIPWDSVRDFGVTYKAVRSGSNHRTSHIYTLYISPTRLSSGSAGRENRRENRALTLSIKGDDVDELFFHEVFDFCEKQINRGREEPDRVKLYLPSDRYPED